MTINIVVQENIDGRWVDQGTFGQDDYESAKDHYNYLTNYNRGEFRIIRRVNEVIYD